jgi:hypothetical protein
MIFKQKLIVLQGNIAQKMTLFWRAITKINQINPMKFQDMFNFFIFNRGLRSPPRFLLVKKLAIEEV